MPHFCNFVRPCSVYNKFTKQKIVSGKQTQDVNDQVFDKLTIYQMERVSVKALLECVLCREVSEVNSHTSQASSLAVHVIAGLIPHLGLSHFPKQLINLD